MRVYEPMSKKKLDKLKYMIWDIGMGIGFLVLITHKWA